VISRVGGSGSVIAAKRKNFVFAIAAKFLESAMDGLMDDAWMIKKDPVMLRSSEDFEEVGSYQARAPLL